MGDQKIEKFNLLVNKRHSAKECISFWKGGPGEFKCKSEHIKFNSLLTKKKDYIERENDQFRDLLKIILAE